MPADNLSEKHHSVRVCLCVSVELLQNTEDEPTKQKKKTKLIRADQVFISSKLIIFGQFLLQMFHFLFLSLFTFNIISCDARKRPHAAHNSAYPQHWHKGEILFTYVAFTSKAHIQQMTSGCL